MSDAAHVREIPVQGKPQLVHYEAQLALRGHVQRLREVAARDAPIIDGHTVWMVSSTAQGGGVAEMLPGLISVLRELGIRSRWLVIEPNDPGFFDLTKRLHNLIHGAEAPLPTETDRALYEAVSERLCEQLAERVCPDDLLVVHDPQPLGCGALLKRRRGVRGAWRCHIGLDREDRFTRAAWDFLAPWLEDFERAVFSVREYVPRRLIDRARVIPPAIDPLSHKNRELSVHKIAGVLHSGGLATAPEPVLYPPFERGALRVQPDGDLGPATRPDDIGLLYRPVVTQISRWDRLKGWDVVLEAFATLKRQGAPAGAPDVQRRRLSMARLVLAGPDPAAIQDDPEGRAVLQALIERWRGLEEEVRRDVALVLLPMEDLKQNALMVNVLQRCSSVVVQASRREGFGLTVTEAMWKGAAVIGSGAVGIRSQIQDGVHGRLMPGEGAPAAELAEVLGQLLHAPKLRDTLGLNAQLHVADNFLLFSQAARWLELLADLSAG